MFSPQRLSDVLLAADGSIAHWRLRQQRYTASAAFSGLPGVMRIALSLHFPVRIRVRSWLGRAAVAIDSKIVCLQRSKVDAAARS
jgi:SpoU rRNA methylase family enzyme